MEKLVLSPSEHNYTILLQGNKLKYVYMCMLCMVRVVLECVVIFVWFSEAEECVPTVRQCLKCCSLLLPNLVLEGSGSFAVTMEPLYDGHCLDFPVVFVEVA